MEEGSPAWESALESIELSLGLGDIQDCFHRYVLDNEFASYFGADTVFASELSLSGSCLVGVLLDDHSEVDFLWCCLPMGFSWSLFFVQMTNENINVELFGTHGISHHERSHFACHLESFDKRGLKTHEQEVQAGSVTCLGNQLDCVGHRSSSHGREVLASQEGS